MKSAGTIREMLLDGRSFLQDEKKQDEPQQQDQVNQLQQRGNPIEDTPGDHTTQNPQGDSSKGPDGVTPGNTDPGESAGKNSEQITPLQLNEQNGISEKGQDTGGTTGGR